MRPQKPSRLPGPPVLLRRGTVLRVAPAEAPQAGAGATHESTLELSLPELRARMDAIDGALLELLNKHAAAPTLELPPEPDYAAPAPGPRPGDIESVTELRARIDAVDDILLELLNKRAGIAGELGCLKRGLPPDSSALRQADREAAILERLAGANKGPLPDGALARIFAEIFRACLEMQGEE